VAKIIVLGGGVCGLAAGLLLRRDGHEVTVLERDAAPLPATAAEAWERWERDGVGQFRQTHYLTPRGREVLDTELPDVRAGLDAAGGVRLDLLAFMPPELAAQGARPGDERFVTVNARRPTLEWVLGRIAFDEPGLELRRGTAVRELLVRDYDGVPHVSGVRTDAGEALHADLVVDAMGRRSPLPALLEAAGAGRLHEEAEDSGFLYYTRFFRGTPPEFRAPQLMPIGTFSVLTIPAEDDTWSVTLYAAAGDQPLKQLRDVERWTALVRACPLHAHWVDGEPLTGVMPMAGIVDRHRRLEGITGLASAGDAWACTNPSLGRGMTMALLHAARLRDVAREHLDEPHEFAAAWDAVTEAELTPWYRETVEEDRDRLREMQALRAGRHYARPPDSPAALRLALRAAAPRDADAFRGFLATRGCLALQQEVCADERLLARVLDQPPAEAPPLPGPGREQLLALLAGSGGGVAQAGEAAVQGA
jgi:2-polyprenyl-6-methoxyphenol hydroxylase-like FAD-dependent oxidoreductase